MFCEGGNSRGVDDAEASGGNEAVGEGAGHGMTLVDGVLAGKRLSNEKLFSFRSWCPVFEYLRSWTVEELEMRYG